MTNKCDVAANYADEHGMKKFYDENGYISIKNGVSAEDIRWIIDDLTAIFSPFSTNPQEPIDSAIIDLDKRDKPKLYELNLIASKLCSLERIGSVVAGYINAIAGKKVPQFHIATGMLLGIPRDNRLVYDYHQESNYMKGFDDIFNIHYPLLRSSVIENGTMSVLAGSHKLETLSYQKHQKTPDSYTDLTPSNIEKIKDSYEERYNILDPGDVLIFHKDLIHRSNFNDSLLARPVGVNRITTSPRGDWVAKSPSEL